MVADVARGTRIRDEGQYLARIGVLHLGAFCSFIADGFQAEPLASPAERSASAVPFHVGLEVVDAAVGPVFGERVVARMVSMVPGVVHVPMALCSVEFPG